MGWHSGTYEQWWVALKRSGMTGKAVNLMKKFEADMRDGISPPGVARLS